jgi:hypothetical protein
MSRKRNAEYKRRKNRKRGRRRYKQRHDAARAPLGHPLALGALKCALPLGQQGTLLLGGRLQHVKKAARRLSKICNWKPPRDHLPDESILSRSHDSKPLHPATRVLDLDFGDTVMIQSFDSVFWGPGREFSGSLAGFQYCPHHSEEARLQIFAPAGSSEFYFRCNLCGTTWKGLEFFKSSSLIQKQTWEETARSALDRGFLAEPISTEALNCYRRLSQWRSAFDSARSDYRHYVKYRGLSARFGDWLVLARSESLSLLSGLPIRLRERATLASINRNVYGFPAAIEVYSLVAFPSAVVKFTDDVFTLNTPRWADFQDWTRDIVVCPDNQMATALERGIARWPQQDRVAVATISPTSQPITTALPFQNVWLPVRTDESPDYGLMMFDGSTNLRVKRFGQVDDELKCLERIEKAQLCDPNAPTCLDVVASSIARDPRDLSLALNTVLAKPHITPAAGRALTSKVAQLRGVAADDLAERIELRSNPYVFRIGDALYACRGQFFRKKRDREFQSISNFALRIESEKPYREGNVILDLVLVMDGRHRPFTVREAQFNSPQRLWKAIRMAARDADMPYPVMTAVPERKLLPELVRGSHAWKPFRPKMCGFPVRTVTL